MAATNSGSDAVPVSLFDPGVASCPHAVYRQLREFRQGVGRDPLMGVPLISRYEDVMAALRQPEIYSSDMSAELALGNERPMIPQQIDPPELGRYRKLLEPLFSRKRMRALVPEIRRQANELIDRFIDKGECEFNSAFAIPLPCSVFLSLLGLPYTDLDTFLDLKDRVIRPQIISGDTDAMYEIRREAGSRITEYFQNEIDSREGKPPGDDLLDAFLSFELDGEKLSREEILDICFLALIAGLDTVTATLGCNMAFFAANPRHRQKIVDDPLLLPSVVEELLRWETPVTIVPRRLRQDVVIGGVEIKEGEIVSLLLGAANLDQREFVAADEVDFDREKNRHLAFGGGPHRCLGSHLARVELQTAMEEWHRRIPHYRIKPGETPVYSAGIREVQYLPLTWEASH